MRTAWTLLVVAALSVSLVSGCRVMNAAPWTYPSDRHSAASSSKAKHKKSSWFSSWFVREEPPPPQTVKEFLDLEPIRP